MDQLVLWSIGLLVIGFVLLLAEVFIPSGGALGVLAGLSIVGSVVIAFLYDYRLGVSMLAAVTLSLPFLLWVASVAWPMSPMGRLILRRLPASEDEFLPQGKETHSGKKVFIGRYGRCKTPMRPGGLVVVDGVTQDAVAKGVPIDPDEPVKVIDVQTNRLVVRPAKESDLKAQDPVDVQLEQPLEGLDGDPFADA